MAIPRNLGNLASGADTSGVLQPSKGGTGLTSPGASGNVLVSNGTAWTSAAPAPSAGTLTAIASGSLANGAKVIINSDGTVSAPIVETQTFGSAAVFQSASTTSVSATYDSANNRVVVAYANGSNFGTAVVGTVSGTSISFGTPVVFNSATSGDGLISAIYNSADNRVVIAYRNGGNSNFGTAIVGTVSGTSISFGTPVVFNSAATTGITSTYDSVNNRVVIAYVNIGNSSRGTAIVGTVSGTSISFGSPTVFNTEDMNVGGGFPSATYDSANNRVLLAYRLNFSVGTGTAVVGTVSGTSISFGTPVTFINASTTHTRATYDSVNNRVVIAYMSNAVNHNAAVVGTISGTSATFGTPTVFTNANTQTLSITYNSTYNRVIIAYSDSTNSNFGTAVVGTVSGTSISFDTPAVFNSATSTDAMAVTYNSLNNRIVIAYRNGGNSNFGTSVVFRQAGSTLTTENYIGISNAAYTNGQTATIQIVGSVDDAQSGLIPGQSYFVQGDGTLSLTPGVPSVFAGTAVSATNLIVKG